MKQGPFPTLANYRVLLRDSQFILALRNTLWLTGVGVSLQLLTGLGVAMVLHKLILGHGLVRTIVLTPLGVPTIVAGVMFTYLFGSAGYLNEILHRLGAINDAPIDWLGGDWRSLGVILVAQALESNPLWSRSSYWLGWKAFPRARLRRRRSMGRGRGADSSTSRFRCCVRRASRLWSYGRPTRSGF